MEIGRILGGRYKIVERIGSGGMSIVYKAHEVGLEREVAVKVLISSLADDPQLIERFNREAKTIASLQHNSIIPIYYYGIEENLGSYLIMPMLKGGTLEQRLHQLELLPSLTEVGELAEKLGSALQYAHNKNVVHRDIKFSNIMFDDAGSPYLMDFGIAKLLNTTNLTGTGMTVGTPNFMPPEQWRNDEITPAVDQYAFAVLLYAMLTRKMPFEAETAPQLMYKHLQEDPPPASDYREDVPAAIEDALQKALSKEPEDRYASVSEFTEIISQSALASTRQYSGFFKAPIAVTKKSKLPTSGIPKPGVMPDTPTEMVAESEIGPGVAGMQGLDGQTTPVEQAALARTQNKFDRTTPGEQVAFHEDVTLAKDSSNRRAFFGTMIAVVLVGIIVISIGLFIRNELILATQSTETAVANIEGSETSLAIAQANDTATAEMEASETARADDEATETIVAFEIQSINETATREAEPTLTNTATDTATPSNTPTDTPTNTPSNTPTNTPTATSTSTATADATGTRAILLITEFAENQATDAASDAITATARAYRDETATTQAENANASATIRAENINGTATEIARQLINVAATTLAQNVNSTTTAIAEAQEEISAIQTQAAQNRIEYGSEVSDTGRNEDEIRWTFRGTAGEILTISARSAEFDTLLALYFNNSLIANDDNSGYRENSRIEDFEIENDGEYTIVLRADRDDELRGEYHVGITEMIDCPRVLPAQALVGEYAHITVVGTRNRIRREAGTDSQHIGFIPLGELVEVIGGPDCEDGFTWYQVEYDGIIGWTAEADDEDYWVLRLPEDDSPILAANGQGMTNGEDLDPGTFQVERFCQDRGWQANVSADLEDWLCFENDIIVYTLVEEDFDEICQMTYGIEDSFARQDGDAAEPAYQWLCYFYPGLTP